MLAIGMLRKRETLVILAKEGQKVKRIINRYIEGVISICTLGEGTLVMEENQRRVSWQGLGSSSSLVQLYLPAQLRNVTWHYSSTLVKQLPSRLTVA